ncbi:MAG: hypothetical protein MR739_13435 [Spirochaetia bacterium]|nr:hypothetical protein [Spirochaetia bacterium]
MHSKLALFRVPYALRATYIPSLRFGTGLRQPFQSLPRVKSGTDLVSYKSLHLPPNHSLFFT